MHKKLRQLFIILMLLFTLACGSLEVGVENPPLVPTATQVVQDQNEDPDQNSSIQSVEDPAPDNTTKIDTAPSTEKQGLDCTEYGGDPLITAACNIKDSFTSRNTQPLLSYMPAEFILAYWQSEGSTVSPGFALDFFQQSLLPPDPLKMTFTTDRTQFPPLFGTPPESMFGPEMEIAMIIYSEGWGEFTEGAVLIYITGNPTDGYQFPAIVVAPQHFDKND